MIERLFLFVCLIFSIAFLLIAGFVMVALAPHIHDIGDMLYDFMRIFYIAFCILVGIGLIELWGWIKHQHRLREIKEEKLWLDSRIAGLPGELIYVDDEGVKHISAIKEGAPMWSMQQMMDGQIEEKKNAIVSLFDEGVQPHQIAQHHKKGIGYVYDVLIKAGRRP